MWIVRADEPPGASVVKAIRGGDVQALKRLLGEHPRLVTASIVGAGEKCRVDGTLRTLLHVATDWPGHFPNAAATVMALIDAGADVNARFTGPHPETPLHWAASSDDVEVLDALLDAGADIEAPGAVIGGGTPLADAVTFGQWRVAGRLVERGARTTLWQAAALGLADRVDQHFADAACPAPGDVNKAFWFACHGGQRRSGEYLLARGADMNWIPPWEKLTPLDTARRSHTDHFVVWLRGLGAKSAEELG